MEATETKLTEGDVTTLIGHANMLRRDGETDMPDWFFGLAERIALSIGDVNLAMQVARIRGNRDGS